MAAAGREGSFGDDGDTDCSSEDADLPELTAETSRQISDVDTMSQASSYKRQLSSLPGDTASPLDSPVVMNPNELSPSPSCVKAGHPLANPTPSSDPTSTQPSSSSSHSTPPTSASHYQPFSSPTSPFPISPYLDPTSVEPVEASPDPVSPNKSPHPTSRPLEEPSQLVTQVLVSPPLSCAHLTSEPRQKYQGPFLQENKVMLVPCKCMGAGFYGEVWEVKHNGKSYAVKKYNEPVTPPILAKLVALTKLNDENVMAYCGIGSLKNKCDIVVVMEKADQNLSSFIERNTELELQKKLMILTGIANGLVYLHSKEIVHCDLKPSNVLIIPESTTAKISDYGNALVKPISTVCADCRTEDAIFRDYFPPEAQQTETHKPSFDVFSFGHLSLYVVLQEQPHSLLKSRKCPNKTARTEVQRREEYLNKMKIKVSSRMLDWTKQCLRDDEEERPQMADFKHIFLST